VIVVGHQTSGKSALIEALMGFQFNQVSHYPNSLLMKCFILYFFILIFYYFQVGGGTKTRRPVALRMQYNPTCTIPLCFLTLDSGKEEQRSLQDIQVFKTFLFKFTLLYHVFLLVVY
jgi:GTPase SAR1 family protein